MRALLGLVVLGLAAWLAYALFSAPPEEGVIGGGETRVWTSSTQCAECHQAIYDEWAGSQHAQSWINEAVRAPSQSDNFRNKDCIDCHAPQPVFLTGIGNRVLPRTSRRAEGVDCITCHLLPSGRMAGTINAPKAPCKPEATIALQRVELCAGCHDQHKTVQQWRITSYADRGEDCLTCHMPFRDGDPNEGRSHLMLGGHHLPLVQQAVELRAARVGGAVQVEVANTGAGHAFPTDERSRAADVFWRPAPDDPDARGGWRHLWRIRDPYRTEVDIPSTLLHAETTKVLTIEDPDAAGPVQVGLFYKLSPYYRDEAEDRVLATEDVDDPLMDAQLVHRVDVE
jgi:hypothetical protein